VRRERGSVTVAAAGVLVVLLVCTMGVADVGRILAMRARGQTAADAAALAAAQELAIPGGTDPSTAAAATAMDNGATLLDCACQADASEAVVTVRRSIAGLWLMPGAITLDVRARAVVDLP
jgi:secretion/DNA translocation related TadE-like protein